MKKFALKKVTIVIDQTKMERERGLYYLRATDIHSPLQSHGTPQKISKNFGQWLSNTIAAMNENECKVIKMEITWK